MPKVEVGDLLEARHDRALSAAPERRVSEQLITEWEQERRRLRHALALMTLDVSAITGPKWAYRFIIAICPVVEDCSLIVYGPSFAALMQLPQKPDYSVSKIAQLPARYVPVFTKGCISSTLSNGAVRMRGAVAREDGRQELYRAAFIRFSLNGKPQDHFALSAFNCRVAERRT